MRCDGHVKTISCCLSLLFSALAREIPLWLFMFGRATCTLESPWIHFAAQTWFLRPQGRAGENNNVSPATLRWENRNINTAERGSLYSGRGYKDGGGSVGCREHQMPQLFLWPNPLPAPVTLSFFPLCPPPWLAITGSHYSMFSPCHLLIMVSSWIQLADNLNSMASPKLEIKITNWTKYLHFGLFITVSSYY